MSYDYDDCDRRADAESERSRYKYNCGGFASWDGPCGASDCSSCRNHDGGDGDEESTEKEVTNVTFHIARRAFRATFGATVNPGDLYSRETGFTYEPGGARTGYQHPKVLPVSRPPGTVGHYPDPWMRAMAKREAQLAARRARAARKSR